VLNQTDKEWRKNEFKLQKKMVKMMSPENSATSEIKGKKPLHCRKEMDGHLECDAFFLNEN
jgi:hypothetical protein